MSQPAHTPPIEATPRRLRRLGAVLPAALLPLLVAALIAARRGLAGDDAGRAELGFLALFAAVAVAALIGFELELGRLRVGPGVALALAATPWLLHQGPRRGAVLSALVVAGFVVVGCRAWRLALTRAPGDHRLDGVWVPAAFLVQVLTRGDLLLPPWLEPRTLVSLVLLPAVAGLSLQTLARLHGPARVLVLAAALVVVAPGWNVTSTAVALALAIGSWASLDRRPTVDAEERAEDPPGKVGSIGLGQRWPWMLGLLALPIWDLTVGTLIAIAALVLFLGRKWSWLTLGLLVLLAVTARIDRSPQEVLLAWVGALALVPSAFLSPATDRWRLRSGALLALVAAWVHPSPEALMAGVAVVALATPNRGVLAGLQGVWSAAMVVGVSLLAAYPWARSEPWVDGFALLGIAAGKPQVMLPLVAIVGLGTLLSTLTVGRPQTRQIEIGVGIGLALVVAALLASTGPATVLFDDHSAVALDTGNQAWTQTLDGASMREVVVDSNLVRGVALPVGTEVARIILRDAEGAEIQRWPLRVGRDTAEWAAGRPNVAGRPGFVAPAPWLSQVSPDGRFFSQRFRRRLGVADAIHPAEIVLERNAELPPEVVVMVYRMELRP